MIETSSLAAAFPPAAVEPIVRIDAARSPRPSADPSLDPAVTLDLSPEARRTTGPGAAPPRDTAGTADRAQYRRDADSHQIVFQVVGPDGAVVEQLPSEAILRARTYAREAEAARAAEIGTAVARSA
ncbi:hypothetical protein [Methylobacterium platani]|uniref:Flagellar protein FlaG n=1 Tax=Methylobacterium platani TaxID=427683 RepID=A0A179SE48_9HYPH|nr:hypothetical protein [Methylobacterium platani]OAS25706.1 hypothetical protein A5481_07620 [Methylobacterium platani]